MTSRRQFIFKTIPIVALTISASGLTQAQAQKIAETDAAATALGYKNDATKVDAKKFPAYAAGKTCSNCMLYQGKATDSWGACGAMGNKLVNGKGWCAAWAKKA